jgi:hypothetical protein
MEKYKFRVVIFVLSHGWVMVGVPVDDGRESGEVRVAYAHTVRRWGTTEGIAQLCKTGPLEGTVLDPTIPHEDHLKINYAHEIFCLECDPSKWVEALKLPVDKTGSLPPF